MSEIQNRPDAEEDASKKGPIEVNFKYFKGNFYRIIHVNGVMGGISRRGEMHMSFYSERPGFPDSAKLVIFPQGSEFALAEQIEGGDKYIREVEVDAVVDLNTAKEIRAWLDTQIETMEASVIESQQHRTTRTTDVASKNPT
jgi:hypothetical protein